jgi:hypothetical protein
MKNRAYLIGPFIGELDWEMYRFAPYAIHLKKKNPDIKLIVYTRSTRFDLYGKFADILIPLYLKNEYKQLNFGMKKIRLKDYELLQGYFIKKYQKKFEVVKHLAPDIDVWRNRIRWQYPRSKMDYNFQPRNDNLEVIDLFIDSDKNVFVANEDNDIRRGLFVREYSPVMYHWFKDVVSNSKSNLRTSFIGCLMFYLKECKFVVSNMSSSVAKLALLMKIPVISINETMTYDSINLLNPFNTTVINCGDIDEGIDIYENNF